MRRLKKLPKKILGFLGKLKERVIEAAEEAWLMEPARVISISVSGVAAVLAALGVTLSSGTIEVVVTLFIPMLLGELIRSRVAPKAKMTMKMGGARLGDFEGSLGKVMPATTGKASHEQEHKP